MGAPEGHNTTLYGSVELECVLGAMSATLVDSLQLLPLV